MLDGRACACIVVRMATWLLMRACARHEVVIGREIKKTRKFSFYRIFHINFCEILYPRKFPAVRYLNGAIQAHIQDICRNPKVFKKLLLAAKIK